VHNLTIDGAGYSIAPNLPPGLYRLSAEAAGFKRGLSASKAPTTNWPPNTALSLNADAVGNITETMEVAASAAVLQTDSAAVQARVGARSSICKN
jgi:hypothetical protein